MFLVKTITLTKIIKIEVTKPKISVSYPQYGHQMLSPPNNILCLEKEKKKKQEVRFFFAILKWQIVINYFKTIVLINYQIVANTQGNNF